MARKSQGTLAPTGVLQLAPVTDAEPRRHGVQMLGSEDIGRVVGEVLASPARERLSALCYRALSRQAAARAVGPIDAETLDVAEASGLTKADADTALGNVLGLLEQGPSK